MRYVEAYNWWVLITESVTASSPTPSRDCCGSGQLGLSLFIDRDSLWCVIISSTGMTYTCVNTARFNYRTMETLNWEILHIITCHQMTERGVPRAKNVLSPKPYLRKLSLFMADLDPSINKYVSPPRCRAEMYAAAGETRRVCRPDRQTDGQTPDRFIVLSSEDATNVKVAVPLVTFSPKSNLGVYP